jgi:tRNA 2-thiouridine synthesizing protein A
MLYEYDATQDLCPLPLVKTRVMLKKMMAGDLCIIQICDSGTKINLPQFLTKYGYTFEIKHLAGITEIIIRT